MIPPRFSMTDHDEMTGTSGWEPAPKFTRPELDVVASAFVDSMTPMVRAVDAGLRALGAAVHSMAATIAKAQQETAADYRLVR